MKEIAIWVLVIIAIIYMGYLVTQMARENKNGKDRK